MSDHVDRALSKNEQGVLAAGAVALVLSLIPGYINVTFDGKGEDISTTAWTSFATIGMVFVLGAVALVAFQAFSDKPLPLSNTVPWHLVSIVLAALGALLVILRAFTVGSSAPGANVGPGWPGWLLIVTTLVLTYFSIRTFRESDDELDLSDAVQDD